MKISKSFIETLIMFCVAVFIGFIVFYRYGMWVSIYMMIFVFLTLLWGLEGWKYNNPAAFLKRYSRSTRVSLYLIFATY
jgi:hypothetical protein